MSEAAEERAADSDADSEPDAKRLKEQARSRTAAARRRDFGLLHSTTQENSSWLRCSVPYRAHPTVLDGKGQASVQYLTADEASELPKDDGSITWDCVECAERYIADKKEGNKLPMKPDAFTCKGRDHHAMRDKSHCKTHRESDYHIETIGLKERAANQSEAEAAQAKQKQAVMFKYTTPEKVLQLNYLLGVIWVVLWECAVALIGPVRDLGHAWGVKMPARMSHDMNLSFIDAAAEFFRRLQRRRISIAQVFSPIGDGSTDISNKEQETVGARYVWCGLPRNEFVELAELDLTQSRDGEPPDAQCLASLYDNVCGKIFTGSTGDTLLNGVRDRDYAARKSD